ncbi:MULTISPECIES: helix-turn-helix domain-containing protein [Bacteroidales]|uniref:helix-turn-helix domain-containing protein n=1 Tax=Bacteroidales TaxID=171549 RepID=UPI00266E9F7D|nr:MULTISPECIES: helix-turn-helix domain-containing protein [Bacteroidales]
MRTEEYRTLIRLIRELASEVREVRTGLDCKIDHVAKKVTEAFQGFGILDPEEETWTEQQVCERYHVSRRTMYEYRKSGLIAYIKTGSGKNCKVKYRKADVMEFFSVQNA